MGVAGAAALAGCNESASSDGETDAAETASNSDGSGTENGSGSVDTADESTASTGGADAAVATELNVYRARLYDAAALGRAGEYDQAAGLAGSVFARFEGAAGENGAHEVLEETSGEAYQGFEQQLEALRSALEAGDSEGAFDAARSGADHLRAAQRSLAGESATHALDVLVFGSRALNAGVLANVGAVDAAGSVAQAALADFESAPSHDPLESASEEAYGAFEEPLEGMVPAAEGGDAQGVVDRARESAEGAVAGAYALTTEAMAGASHVALLQARGFDAAAAAPLGGPGASYAHAATLNSYRATAFDAQWLARRGGTDTAGKLVEDTFAHFEGAQAHDPLEAAAAEAYEGFESGLDALSGAIDSGDTDGIDDAVDTVDSNLVAGIDALAGDDAPVLQAGFFKARLADARELYRQDKNAQAASAVSDLFARFEADELGFHEAMEVTDEDLYHRFEEQHLAALGTAYEDGDDDAVETHHEGALAALLEFEAAHTPALASGSGATYMAALGFDAAAVDALGHDDRAATLAQNALAYFESGAAGYHEALEDADEGLYHSFEDEALGAVISAADNGEGVYGPVQTYFESTVDTVYAVVGSGGGGGGGGVAQSVVRDMLGTFESARTHDPLAAADAEAYEAFEGEMESYLEALGSGGDPAAFADAARTAQFALLAGSDAAPSGDGSSDENAGGETETDASLSGGPNVVSDVPDDADHVVEMQAVAFEPAELTVSVGDTVAFEHVGGEPHNVVAREGGIPEEADYWASGGFASEDAAVEGWENGQGAVQSGQSYVRTFETAGEHPYYCVPHEAAGMEGTIVVEE